jgi:CHAT domain-containing protein
VTVRRASILLVCIVVFAAGTSDLAGRIDMSTTLDDCDALVAADREDLTGYQCYWFVGRNHARLDAAARRLDQLLETDPGNHRARLYLGIVLADLGSDRAGELLAQAADEFSAEQDAQGEIYARISLAIWSRHRGRTDEASAELDKALAAAVGSGNSGLEAQVRVDLGWQKHNEGDYGGAWQILKEVEPLVFPDGSSELQLAALDALAAVSWSLGRYTDALAYYRRELEILAGGDAYRESSIRRNIALVARRLGAEGRLAEGEIDRMFRDAVDAAVRAGNRYAEAGARVMLASSLQGPEGLGEARRALEVARETRNLNNICWALWLVGEKRLKLDPEKTAAAYAPIEESLELARGRGSAELYAQGMLVLARMRWNTGPRERAIEDSLAALDAIERIRDLQQDGEVKARVMSRFASAYRWLQGMLLQHSDDDPGYIETAFAVSERLRARSLLDTLDAAGATERIAPSGPDADRRSEVLDEIATVRSNLARGGATEEETERLLARLAELEKREAELRKAIAEIDESFANLRGASLPDLQAVRRALDPGQALVSFVIEEIAPGQETTSGSWALVITSDDAVAIRLTVTAGLPRMIRLYVSLLGRRDGMEREGAERLYQTLLRDAVETLPAEVTSLIVLPDGQLYRVPFGALVDDRTGGFVAERFEMTVVPSAATWLRWRKSTGDDSRTSLLGFADPSPIGYPAGDEQSDLRPLPHARREVEGMRRQLGREGRVFEGNEATETALKTEDLAGYRVIHLAAHAVVNHEHPERSAVLLGPDATRDGNDGVVAFDEVVALDLDGQVVLLSACRSASGPLVGGEGVMGLANAFFQAGARTVVASLWPVRDRETAALVNRFGAHIGDGNSVASALSLARRDLVRSGAPPASWAGMAVLGDGDVVLVRPGRSTPSGLRTGGIIALALIVIIIVVAGVYFRRT